MSRRRRQGKAKVVASEDDEGGLWVRRRHLRNRSFCELARRVAIEVAERAGPARRVAGRRAAHIAHVAVAVVEEVEVPVGDVPESGAG